MDNRIQLIDSDFVIIEKQPFELTVPSRRGLDDDREVLGIKLQNLLKSRVFPVHRLDYGVGGLVLFARNEEAQRRANSWFEKRLIKKKYLALTHNQDMNYWPIHETKVSEVIQGGELIWKSALVRGKKRSSIKINSPTNSETLANVIQRDPIFWTWILSPLTGKPHQLRIELARRGCPIIGDELYGSNLRILDSNYGISLWAVELDFSNIGDWNSDKKNSKINRFEKYFFKPPQQIRFIKRDLNKENQIIEIHPNLSGILPS